MAVTVVGFQGTISDVQMSTQQPHHAPCVYASGDLAPTIVVGQRQVSVAAGSATAGFVKYTSDAAQVVNIPQPAAGTGRWYAITLDRQWSPTNTVTLKADDLAVATDGTVPTTLPATVAAALAGLPNSPGSAGNPGGQRQLLAAVHVRNADTTLTLFDRRLQRTGSGLMRAFHLAALPVLAAAGHLLEGSVVTVGSHLLQSGGTHVRSTWRRTATAWVPDGRLTVNDAAATNPSAPGTYSYGATTGTFRADLVALAAIAYAVPLLVESPAEAWEASGRVMWRWHTGLGKWMPWESEWYVHGSPTNYTNGANGSALASHRWDRGDLALRAKVVFGSSSPALGANVQFPIPNGISLDENTYMPMQYGAYQRASVGMALVGIRYQGGLYEMIPLGAQGAAQLNSAVRQTDGVQWPWPNPAQSDTLWGELRLQVK